VSNEYRDAVTASVLAAFTAAGAYAAVITLDPRFMDPNSGSDVWFEGDLPRIVNEISHRWAPHSRAPVHPLFSLFACAAVYAMRAIGLSTLHAVAALIAGGAAIWTVLLFLVLRTVTPSRTEAVLFTAVGATTAAALFWLAVPETYVFGSATMLAALWVAALAERRRIPEGWFVAASAATLAVTISNWAAGIAATAITWPWRRTLQISVNAFAVVVALWSLQRVMIPRADFFLGYSNEQRYLLRPEAGGPRRTLTVMLAHAIVMPPVETRDKPNRGRVMSVQFARLAAGGPARRTGLIAWFALVAIGLYGWLQSIGTSGVMRAVGVVAAAEITLHVLYGTETFLYSLNLVPLLVIIAACGTRTRARFVVGALAAVLIVCGGGSNIRTWLDSRRYFVLSPPHHPSIVPISERR
jgi:hypothetical protein